MDPSGAPSPSESEWIPPIYRLPAELLTQVADELSIETGPVPGHTNRPARDLNNLCRSSKRLKTFAQIALYQSISIHLHTTTRPSTPLYAIVQLVRTMLTRPDLAAHTRTFSILRDSGKWAEFSDLMDDPIQCIPINDEDIQGPVAFVEGARGHIQYADLWIRRLQQGFTDAFLAVLLLQFPTLEHLRILTYGTPLVEAAMSSAIMDNEVAAWTRLRCVEFRQSRHGARGGSVRMTPLYAFYLPEVVTIKLGFITQVVPRPLNGMNGAVRPLFTSPEWPDGRTPMARSLKQLEINTPVEEDLGYVLRSTPNLTNLIWSKDARDVDLGRLGQALAPVRDSLTDLAIRSPIAGRTNHGSLQELPDLEKLRRLSLESGDEGILAHMICAAPNIKYLYWNDATRSLVDFNIIMQVMSHVRNSLTELVIKHRITSPMTPSWSLNGLPSYESLRLLTLNTRDTETLAHVLKSAPNVKSLSWSHNGGVLVDLGILEHALSYVKNSLVTLSIAQPNVDRLTLRGSLGGLVGFKALKKLHVPMPYLLGSSPNSHWTFKEYAVLPESVDKIGLLGKRRIGLAIPWGRPGMEKPLMCRLEECLWTWRSVNGLQRFRLDVWHDDEPISSLWLQLVRLCACLEIGFEMRHFGRLVVAVEGDETAVQVAGNDLGSDSDSD